MATTNADFLMKSVPQSMIKKRASRSQDRLKRRLKTASTTEVMLRGNATTTKVTGIGREVEATTSIEEGETHPTTTIGVASTLKVVPTTTRLTSDLTTTATVVATGCMATLSSTKAATTTTIEIDKASIKVREKLVRMVDLLSPQVMVVQQRGMQMIKARKEPTNDDNSPQGR